MNRRAFLSTSLLVLAGCAVPPGRQTAAPTGSPTASGPVILADGLDFPEGPAFAPDGSLWCTEIGAGNLIHLVEGRVERIHAGGRPNSLAFDAQGRAWFPDSASGQIRRYTPSTGEWEVLLDAIEGVPLLAPNDLCFDSAGSLLFTCPNYASTERSGYVACLRADGSARVIGQDFYRPNGLDLLDGGAALVVADTYQKVIFRGAWDPAAAAWSDPQPWAQVGGAEGPDGMSPAPGTGGQAVLYCAIYGDSVIRGVDAGGKVVAEMAVPGKNPTNLAFDPSGRLGWVVTEAETGRLIRLPWEGDTNAL